MAPIMAAGADSRIGLNRMAPASSSSAACAGELHCGHGSVRDQQFVAAPIGADRAVFERQVGRSSILVLVDVLGPVVRFVAACRMMAPAETTGSSHRLAAHAVLGTNICIYEGH